MEREYAEYLIRKTKQDYNSIADDFSRTRKFQWPELNFLGDSINEGEKILDLGCGNGRLLEILKFKKIDYLGIDFSGKLIEIAQKNYPEHKFQIADALNLPFPENYFDKIYSIAVFHHIPSEEFQLKFLKEAKRVLKPEGILILTVWNLWSWQNLKLLLKFNLLKILGKSKLDFNDVFVPWGKYCQRYVHNFTQRELKDLTKKTGFKINEAGFINRGKHKKANIYLISEK